jgi:hypothetical protein
MSADLLSTVLRECAFEAVPHEDGTIGIPNLCGNSDHQFPVTLDEAGAISLGRGDCDCPTFDETLLQDVVELLQSTLEEKLKAGQVSDSCVEAQTQKTQSQLSSDQSTVEKSPAQAPKPHPLPVQLNNIPDELKALPQWVVWRYQWRLDKKGKGKWTKPPYQPNGELAKSHDKEPEDLPHAIDTWSSFEGVKRAYERGGFDGIGFVLTEGDPYAAFDLDHCINSNFEIIDPRVANYVARLNSYTERTPGGDGLRVITRARLPPDGRRKGNLECYDN